MDYQFENRYYAADKVTTEYIERIYCKRLNWLSGVAAVGGTAVFLLCMQRNQMLLASVGGLCAVLSVLSFSFVPQIVERLFNQMERQAFQGEYHEIVIRLGKDITLTEGPFSISLPYSKLRQAVCLRYAYLLRFDTQDDILLRYDSFTKGRFSELIPFLKERCPNAQIKG